MHRLERFIDVFFGGGFTSFESKNPKFNCTPLKTNIEPENEALEKEIPALDTILFRFHVSFPGGNWDSQKNVFFFVGDLATLVFFLNPLMSELLGR